DATYSAEGVGAGAVLAIEDGVTVEAFSGDLTLEGGGGVSLPATATATASGTLTLDVGGPAPAGGSVSTLEGTLDATSATVHGGAGADVVRVDLKASPSLSIDLGAGSDTFDVTPSASAPIDLVGGDPAPPASPGDTFHLNLTGVTTPALTSTTDATGLAGTWTFGNRKDVTFRQIETLDPAPPKVTSAGAATFTAATAGAALITTAGTAPVALAAAGLPVGVTFTDNGDGTATLSGTPVVPGKYTVVITATNVAGTATQALTLTVR